MKNEENEREKKTNGVLPYSLWALRILFFSLKLELVDFSWLSISALPVLTFGFQVISTSGQGILDGVKKGKLNHWFTGTLISDFLPWSSCCCLLFRALKQLSVQSVHVLYFNSVGDKGKHVFTPSYLGEEAWK